MDVNKLEKFWVTNQRWLENAKLKIMGGEPTVHPEFLRVARLGKLLFERVALFTNGTKLDFILDPEVLSAHWDDRFEVIINGYTFDFEEWGKYSKHFKSVWLHFVVPFNTIENEIQRTIEKLFQCTSFVPQSNYLISGDTQVNLFHDETLDQYRKNFLYFMQNVIPRLIQVGIPFGYDHHFPHCFWTQEMIDEQNKYGISPMHLDPAVSCCDRTLGLLDTNFDLWYCNQTRLKIGPVLEKNGEPRDVQEVLKLVKNMPAKKCKEVSKYNYRCRNCRALPSCKTACWFNHVLPENHKG
jgi:hypothetical protein